MKVQIGLNGGPNHATPARPDFEMLRAGLAAAQATTPTAQANGQVPPDADRAEALVRLFGAHAGIDPPGRALRGSFNPDLAATRAAGYER